MMSAAGDNTHEVYSVVYVVYLCGEKWGNIDA
ncbi:hypothetical protein U370_00725 [Anaplasma marginale str. Dawn]|nr:hypothetical protein U128_00710 [Anaplasma marginale str. Gypsy Plains]AGZ80092.1 hypothetical protein U370_00725 [Anaplasma marginale str. Dawn]